MTLYFLRQLKLIFILNFLIIFIVPFSCAATKQQEVYLADEPLPKIVKKIKDAAKLRGQELSSGQIIARLKEKHLQKVTPRFAQEKFNGLIWKDNDLQQEHVAKQGDLLQRQKGPYVYPAVVICYVNNIAGYGLFTLERIKKDSVIAEYVGKHIKKGEEEAGHFYSWILSNNDAINAEHEGNVARFVLHAPCYYSGKNAHLNLYEFYTDINNIDFCNTKAIEMVNNHDQHDQRFAYVAIRDIGEFEQILINYGSGYWSSSMVDPQLFYKDGEVIPRDKYRGLNERVFVVDLVSEDMLVLDKSIFSISESDRTGIRRQKKGYTIISCAHLPGGKDLKIYNMKQTVSVHRNMPANNPLLFVVKDTVWQKQMAKVRDVPPFVTGFLINSYTDIDRFISLLQKMDGYRTKDRKVWGAILNAAKENKNNIVTQLLAGTGKKFSG